MCLIVTSSLVILIIVSPQTSAKDACESQVYLNPQLSKDKVYIKNISKDCSQINFEGNEKLNSHLGSVTLLASLKNQNYVLNITFSDIKWTKAYLKVSELNKETPLFCKHFSPPKPAPKLITETYSSCFNSSEIYELNFRAELNTDVLYKKVIFKLPPANQFGTLVEPTRRAIFTSIDASSNSEIVLNIQQLHNVSYYKVEVYKEKDDTDTLLDVRMLKPQKSEELKFSFITYNEEGFYYFKVSAVTKDCPEDACLKSLSPKVYIKRKYPPLVIGIVGASFLIPFVLFLFHMWTRRTQLEDEQDGQKDKVFVVYNQTPEKHYAIVKTLEKSLKSLAKVELVSKIAEATHILYICGTHIFEPDPNTHKYLVIEANKAISNVEIVIVSFPYSTKEIPPHLKKCLRFELMEDFGKLIHVFNCDAEYGHNSHYQDLTSKVKAAQNQTEPQKIMLNMPIIIVTEQSDGSDTEPKEIDDLL